jgi:hypothetical protein
MTLARTIETLTLLGDAPPRSSLTPRYLVKLGMIARPSWLRRRPVDRLS